MMSFGREFGFYPAVGAPRKISLFYRKTAEAPVGLLFWCTEGRRLSLRSRDAIGLPSFPSLYGDVDTQHFSCASPQACLSCSLRIVRVADSCR